MSYARLKLGSVCGCFAALIVLSSVQAEAGGQNTANTQNASLAQNAPVARLQISGTGDSLSVDVERSDVQSALKAVLKQAGKQYAPDATVVGQVTLLLTDQPLDTVLNAICEESYLKYRVDQSGIYHFTRDTAAIQGAFTQLKQLNSQLREQLRALGLDIPSEVQFGAPKMRSVSPRAFGGTLAKRGLPEQSKEQLETPSGPAGPVNAVPQNTEATAKPDAKAGAAPQAVGRSSPNKASQLQPKIYSTRDLNQLLGTNNQFNVQDSLAYGRIVQQNGFVWFNIPEEKPEPVTSVLQLFSEQSSVPILVDQSIPNSLKFRVWGSLSPRQLPEALNILAPTAHLQWRWIGSTIFVVPAPNFTVSFSDPASQRSAYPPAARPENSSGGEAQGRRGGSD